MKFSFSSIWYHVFCLSVAIFCVFPLIWALGISFKIPSEVFSGSGGFSNFIPEKMQWSNYAVAWTQGGFKTYLFNSVFYSICVVVPIIFISSLAAYAFSRLDFPYKNILFFLLIFQLMIPIPGAIVAIYVLLQKFGLIDTRIGYILPQINAGLAFSIFILRIFFDKIPKDIEESAYIEGCNHFQVYWGISLPLVKPALAVVSVFNVLNVWNEYLLASLVFSTDALMPLQKGLIRFQGSNVTNYPLLMAGVIIVTVPILIVYFCMQKYIVSGVVAGATTG